MGLYMQLHPAKESEYWIVAKGLFCDAMNLVCDVSGISNGALLFGSRKVKPHAKDALESWR